MDTSDQTIQADEAADKFAASKYLRQQFAVLFPTLSEIQCCKLLAKPVGVTSRAVVNHVRRPEQYSVNDEMRRRYATALVELKEKEGIPTTMADELLALKFGPSTSSASDTSTYVASSIDDCRVLDRLVLHPRPLLETIYGRDKLLADMSARITDPISSGQRIVLRGPAGQGKTTFVRHLSYEPRVLEYFGDQILRSHSLTLSPEESLLATFGAWAKTLGVPAIPSDDRQQTNLKSRISDIRDRLKERMATSRYLIILDDLWLEKHLLMFDDLGDRHTYLITTRNRDWSRGEIVDMQGLDDESALAIMLRQNPDVGRPPDEVIERCRGFNAQVQGNPMALIAANGIVRRHGVCSALKLLQSPEPLLGQQVQAKHMEHLQGLKLNDTELTVIGVLSVAVTQLNPAARLALQSLKHFAPKPATFRIKLIFDYWQNLELGGDQINLFEELLQFGFIEHARTWVGEGENESALDEGNVRYWIHWLNKTVAQTLSETEDNEEIK